MDKRFDPRIVPPAAVRLVLELQRRAPCHLGGGAALAGLHLRHRLSRDLDLFCHEAGEVRLLAASLPEVARVCGTDIAIVRDAGTFVRATACMGDALLGFDIVHDAVPHIAEPDVLQEGVVIESFADLRAAKLTCILSRSEPRDLVDLLFLDRAGFPPEDDLPLALRKDAGIDPAILAWLLKQFPVAPLPTMLEPVTEAELAAFRDSLGNRLRRRSLP